MLRFLHAGADGQDTRFRHVDLVMLSGLQTWMVLLLMVAIYDINCQYRIWFERRIAAFCALGLKFVSILRTNFPKTTVGVGKFHLPGHNAKCRFKFSFHFLPGVGMTDGEASERNWTEMNGLALRTREMSAGHRHDVINFFNNDMNLRKLVGMREWL